MTNFMNFMSNNGNAGNNDNDNDNNNDNESKERLQSAEQVAKSTKEALEHSLTCENKDLLQITFTENNSVNRRIISALGFYGIYTVKKLLLMDIDEFGKRYGVGEIMINYIKLKIKELIN